MPSKAWKGFVLVALALGVFGVLRPERSSVLVVPSAAGAQGGGAANSGQASAPPAAGQKPGEGAAKPPDARSGEPGRTTAESHPSRWVRNLTAIVKALEEFLSGSISFPLLALVGLVLFHKQLIDILKALNDAIPNRSVTLEVGTISLAVAEPAQEPIEDVGPTYLPSPFDLEDDAQSESPPDFHEIPPQLTFHLSDSVAEYWERHRGGAPAVEQMRRDRQTLSDACGGSGVTLQTVRPALNTFVRSLERARFREASELASIIDQCPALREGLRTLKPQDPATQGDDFFVLHATGVAFAQRDRWDESFSALDRITWKDGNPLYVPAASMWLAAGYHRMIGSLLRTPGTSLKSDQVLGQVKELLQKGNILLQAVTSWDGAGVQAPKGYYLREIHKDLGDVASTFAAQRSGDDRRRLLDQARRHLEQCATSLDGEEPTPLDHNNLADYYRQLGDDAKAEGHGPEAGDYYRLAHAQMHRAFATERPSDPAYHNTLALLLYSEGQFVAAYQALAEYPFELARARPGTQDLEQYFANRILASKLVVAQHRDRPQLGLWAAIDVLNEALARLREVRFRLEEKADAFEAQMQELLGHAYLQSPRAEERAVEALNRLVTLRRGETNVELTFRANVRAAAALGRYARLQRRRHAPAAASALREDAGPVVAKVLEQIKAIPVGGDVTPGELRARNIGTRLDALRSVQLLAEEWYGGREDRKARELATSIAEPLAGLRAAIADAAAVLGDAASDMRGEVKHITARLALLRARLLVREDASLSAPDTPAKVKEALTDARGVSGQMDAEAELVLGAVLLNAARLRIGDYRRDYDAAVAAFERAAEADAPALRRESVRQLAQAAALRGVILRKPPVVGRSRATAKPSTGE